MASRNLRDGQMNVEDGSDSTPETILLAMEAGDLNWTENKNYVQVLDRGALGDLRPGDEAPCEVGFSIKHVDLAAPEVGAPTLREALLGLGEADDWVSTMDGVHTVRLVFRIAAPPDTDQKAEIVTFEKFAVQSIGFQEGDPNAINVKGIDWEFGPTITTEEES